MKGPLFSASVVDRVKYMWDYNRRQIREVLAKYPAVMPILHDHRAVNGPTEQQGTLLDQFEVEMKSLEDFRKSSQAAEEKLQKLQDQQVELDAARQSLLGLKNENARLLEEGEAKSAELRRLHKEVDPEEIALRVMYAAEEATKAKQAELAQAKLTIATLESEVAELKRSKKRLRDALDRLSKDT